MANMNKGASTALGVTAVASTILLFWDKGRQAIKDKIGLEESNELTVAESDDDTTTVTTG